MQSPIGAIPSLVCKPEQAWWTFTNAYGLQLRVADSGSSTHDLALVREHKTAGACCVPQAVDVGWVEQIDSCGKCGRGCELCEDHHT